MSLQQAYDALVAAGEITPDPAQTQALPILDEILTHFATPPDRTGLLSSLFAKAPEPPKGAYLWGGVGRGKSFLMDLFFAEVPTQAKRRVHFHAFMQEIHQGLAEARKQGVDDALRPVAEEVAKAVDLLCFDEMQITDITDAMLVGRLFEVLFSKGVVVVTTSNRVPDDLYKDGLNRQLFLPFIAQIKERMVVHHLQSDTDYRQSRLAQSDRYFTPADAAARTEIDRIWQGLTGGVSEPLVLTVKGRALEIDRFSNGVARMSFWELCARPLGAADYLALAQAVRVLILEEIPQLSQYNFNEAKRFVTLIDALYEARTRLIASAAEVPDRLYVEGEGAFEFERTASRLQEMQSAGWGT